MKYVRFLFGFDGRAGRAAMVVATLVFVGIGLLRGQFSAGGFAAIATGLLVLQLLLIWPAQIAVPVRRLHDMGRSGRWVAVFWGGALFGAAFIILDLATRAPLVDMTWRQALSDSTAYVAAIREIAATAPPEDAKRYLPLSATGWGGFSLVMIFLIIQFGWLHLIPGQTTANRFGEPNGRPDVSTR